jgi:glycosyltransferase involved in cell wall biosynthesis
VFIGSGSEKERLVARSRREGLEEMVSWVEPLPKEELARILPRMDAGLMILKNLPEFYYGTSPNKFFDYISCGLPVINNYPGWLADMIGERGCGLATPPGDAEKLADAAVWLRDHAEAREEMGRQARQLAEERFSRDRLGAAFVGVLEEARASFSAPG